MKFPERKDFYSNRMRKRSSFSLSELMADWMQLDMQYCHTCDMYRINRDPDFTGRTGDSCRLPL